MGKNHVGKIPIMLGLEPTATTSAGTVVRVIKPDTTSPRGVVRVIKPDTTSPRGVIRVIEANATTSAGTYVGFWVIV